jgi:hypothetical protein
MLHVRTVVEIPPFVALGVRDPDGITRVALEDVSAYLTTLAAVFDEAGANSDLGLAFRAVRDGLAEYETEDVA